MIQPMIFQQPNHLGTKFQIPIFCHKNAASNYIPSHCSQPTHSFHVRHIGFELNSVGNINKYLSVKSLLKLRVSESNFVFFASNLGFYVLKVFQQKYSFYLDCTVYNSTLCILFFVPSKLLAFVLYVGCVFTANIMITVIALRLA